MHVGTLKEVSELPFILQNACRNSGVGELAALSLVDLWIQDRARLQFVLKKATKTVGPDTTPSMLRRASSFKVTILPPKSRG